MSRLGEFDVPFLDGGYKKTLALQVFQVHLLNSGIAPGRDVVQDAWVDFRLDRNSNDQITLDPALAGKPVTRIEVLLAEVLRDAVLYLAFFDYYPALAAKPLPAAGRIHVDACLHSGVEDTLRLRTIYFLAVR